MKFTGLILTAVAAGLLLSGCTHREHENPLDVENEATLGMPQNLHASSDKNTVMLRWTEPELDDLDNVHIYRQLDGLSDFEEIDVIAAGLKRYTDPGRDYDVPLSYRIAFSGPGWISLESEAAGITPGPYQFWVTDYRGGSITRLTYDARHVAYAYPKSLFPRDVAINHEDGIMWASDYTGYVVRHDLEAEESQWLGGFEQCNQLIYDAASRWVWLVSEAQIRLSALNHSGSVQLFLDRFKEITDIKASPQGGVWLTDGADSSLVRVETDGSETRYKLGASPRSLALTSTGDSLWVGFENSLSLYHIPPQLSQLNSLALNGTVVALDATSNAGCWACVAGTEYQGKVLHVGGDGLILLEIDGIEDPVDVVAVPGQSGGCVVVNRWAGTVTRYDMTGQVIGRREGFQLPERVTLH